MKTVKKTTLGDKLFDLLSSGKVCLGLLVLYLVNQCIIAVIVHPLGADMLNLQMTMNGALFAKIVQGWTPDQLSAYYRHFYFDFPHPFIYAAFLASAVATLSKQLDAAKASMHRFLFYLPFVAATCDLLENCLHLVLIPMVPDVPGILVTISGAATNIKWFLAFTCLGGVGYLGFRRLLIKKVTGK
ncbi:hypothetical protein Dalk_5281 [Desulfatibacillum aliphaticivorans]|uniref:Uncharacterized protein n=1 Tax=Desulfatibacillum aliphaticivorans TaxID=218208 RepID=B8FEH0_DESAL|nr:hypothetical protein [Desulfatibacillum aliphaticivorans]ACL06951.1 hypothetical protein Dalk_5281 [Desulfatibacillum aliphaticivorans]